MAILLSRVGQLPQSYSSEPDIAVLSVEFLKLLCALTYRQLVRAIIKGADSRARSIICGWLSLMLHDAVRGVS